VAVGVGRGVEVGVGVEKNCCSEGKQAFRDRQAMTVMAVKSTSDNLRLTGAFSLDSSNEYVKGAPYLGSLPSRPHSQR